MKNAAAVAVLLAAAGAAVVFSKKRAAPTAPSSGPAGYPGNWITYANITIAPPPAPAPGMGGLFVNLMDMSTTPPHRVTVQIQALNPNGVYTGDVTAVDGVMTTSPQRAEFTLANVAQMASDGLGTPING